MEGEEGEQHKILEKQMDFGTISECYLPKIIY